MLYQKPAGDFLYLFITSISTFKKIKIRTYIKTLGHASLHLNPKNMYTRFAILSEISMFKKCSGKVTLLFLPIIISASSQYNYETPGPDLQGRYSCCNTEIVSNNSTAKPNKVCATSCYVGHVAMSQNFGLGPSCHFMKCKILC